MRQRAYVLIDDATTPARFLQSTVLGDEHRFTNDVDRALIYFDLEFAWASARAATRAFGGSFRPGAVYVHAD